MTASASNECGSGGAAPSGVQGRGPTFIEHMTFGHFKLRSDHNLAKVGVVGSNPIARSKTPHVYQWVNGNF
jgi:hypothetical protein